MLLLGVPLPCKIRGKNLICGRGGTGRRARLRFRPVCDFIVDYGFGRFHI